MDSICVVFSILDTLPKDQRHSTCIQQIHELLNRDWLVHVTHIYRKGNHVANLLAHFGHTLPPKLHLIDTFRPYIIDYIKADIRRIAFLPFIINIQPIRLCIPKMNH
ncbi:hypothetical protein LINGRAHAP2_LOCUS18801 [Linum grandiflorum]